MRNCTLCQVYKATNMKFSDGICAVAKLPFSSESTIDCLMFREDTSSFCELDPTGRKPNDPGAKLDQGKNRLGLVLFGFARALQAVGRVGTYGAKKYSDNGWMQVPDGERRYTDALMRHLMKEAAGEEKDTDTDLLHASHAAWNALARLELMLREREAKV